MKEQQVVTSAIFGKSFIKAKQTNKFFSSGPNTSGPTYVFNIFRHKHADEHLLNAKVAPAGYRFFYGIQDAVLFQIARPQVSNHTDDFCSINAWVMISIRRESDSLKVIQETGIIKRLCRADVLVEIIDRFNDEQLDDLKRESEERTLKFHFPLSCDGW